MGIISAYEIDEARGLTSCLRIAHRPLGYLHYQGQWAPFLYYERSGALLGSCLAHIFCQDRAFFLLKPVDDLFHAADVQCNPTIPLSVLPAPPVSSLCLDANEEIDLQATGSPSCWSLHLCQMNQMQGGEPSELLVAEGYWIAIGAKPLNVVDETFCSIPTYGTNCHYLDSLTFGHQQREVNLQKRGSEDGVSVVFPMIKSAKG